MNYKNWLGPSYDDCDDSCDDNDDMDDGDFYYDNW